MSQISQPFDPITGDLLPHYRELYLQSQLPPALTLEIEEYLKSNTVQTGIMLGRYHELAAAARQQGRTFTAPVWVQRQLLFQPSATPMGPLRRPLVRVVGTVLLLLCVASVVQWIRNEPLVPAPVAAAVVRAATSVRQATQNLANKSLATLHLSEPTPAASASSPDARSNTRPAVAQRQPAAKPAPLSLAAPRPVALVLADSAAPAAAATPASAAAPAALAPIVGPVQGHIYDEDGEPLAGATVLVVGSKTATSTNAEGRYVLEVPAGAMLQFGYAGYAEKLVRSQPGTALNVTLEQRAGRRRAAL